MPAEWKAYTPAVCAPANACMHSRRWFSKWICTCSWEPLECPIHHGGCVHSFFVCPTRWQLQSSVRSIHVVIQLSIRSQLIQLWKHILKRRSNASHVGMATVLRLLRNAGFVTTQCGTLQKRLYIYMPVYGTMEYIWHRSNKADLFRIHC